MHNIPNAEMSPRVVNGVIRWYVGDTFELQVNLDLKDQDGEEIIIQSGQTVEFRFLDKQLHLVKSFVFDNVENNKVILDFDEDVTALFPKGNYTYDIYYDGAKRTTLADDNKVVVE